MIFCNIYKSLCGKTVLITVNIYIVIFILQFFNPVVSFSKSKDAIIVLAGNLEERVPISANLFWFYQSHSILLSNDGVRRGWSHQHQRNLYSIERSEIALVKAGIPASSIIKLPYTACGTVHDARAVRTYIQSHPVKSLLLVTSDYHTKRALWIFKRVFKDLPVTIEVAPVLSGWSSTVPIMLEPIKTVYYWLRYGLLEDP